LCVVDSKNNIKGMITREDLYKLQHWKNHFKQETQTYTIIKNPLIYIVIKLLFPRR
jgi:hypothetical protein